MDASRTAVCLVGHGMPPRDLPRGRILELGQLENMPRRTKDEEDRRQYLERKVREWPRTADNDPYWHHLRELAASVKAEGGYAAVAVAFNELCAPTVGEAVDALATDGAKTIVVVPVMVSRGGAHAERDIAESVEAARARHNGVTIVYAWPFEPSDVVSFFRRQIDRFLEG